MPHFAHISAALSDLLKKGTKFVWTAEAERAFLVGDPTNSEATRFWPTVFLGRRCLRCGHWGGSVPRGGGIEHPFAITARN